ncbi:AIPR family protein [Rhodococcoides corynebacterioides]|uniref:AIPR family protein n=1 Tax=Rhodococcoides corynebacterioides TaxID=53972 RepID=A0ABS7P3L8_9NOCA|nr:AIPR family protein [Rhodococcus corynebacterioides]MBY6366988.1 AIPR family protein [Rhodococcus corynebacterioides]MBY6407249.1 AIPR family protein [Rhodococcus corynebacterioides]
MAAQGGSTQSTAGYAAFESRDDLQAYGDNALLLFVAQMRLGFDDVDTFASNSLTDGNNDKKCDLVAVSADKQRIVLAQGYMTSKVPLGAAPANKASDLNTGVSWLLDGDLDKLPETLRGAAEEVRDALHGGEIRELQLWYVHNCVESSNVGTELAQAIKTANRVIKATFPDLDIDVSATEIGRSALEDEYARMQAPILVSEEYTFKVPGGFELSAQDWSAFSTAVAVADLRALWADHKASLMSPNLRDYLGVVRSSGNINFGIKETAKGQPDNFAIYNNGITVLVNDYVHVVDDDGKHTLRVKGVGIVNGGQTTGALGSLDATEAGTAHGARVMARFVKCTNESVLGDIVKYNNTQNKVEATDFRSKDAVQDRLRKEFSRIPEADYRGGRRGGTTDAILRMKTLVPDSSVAQSLAAFHGEPNLAYNETRSIWDNDAVYSSVFRDTVTASHIVYAYGLLKAIEKTKKDMLAIPENSRTRAQKQHAAYFSARGSNYLLMAALGSCIETVLGVAIADRYALSFKKNLSPADATKAWQPVVELATALSSMLSPATDRGLKSQDRVRKAIEDFSAMLEVARSANPGPFDALADMTYTGV